MNADAAAAARKVKPSILRGQQKKKFKPIKIPSGAITMMMANKQLGVLDDDDNVQGRMIYAAKIANIDYFRCDSLVPKEEPLKEIHNKVNLSHAEEIQYIK